jgi:PleD family two-component response regulator
MGSNNHDGLPSSLSETPRSGKILLAGTDEHTGVKLRRVLDQLPWEVVPVRGLAAVVHEVNANQHSGCVVLASFDPEQTEPDRLARRLAAFPAGSNYLIFLLNDHEPGTVASAFTMGATDVLTRPIEISELRARLEHAWQYLELQRLRERIGVNGALMAEMSTATVVHSRNYLQNELGKEIERSRRYGHSLAVVLAEATLPYGPAEGAVRGAGRYLLELIRKDIDWVARYERHSFAIVLPETGVRSACSTARRLSAKLQDADLNKSGLPTGTRWQFGVSAFNRIITPDAPSAELLLISASEYLESARRNGPHAVAGGYANLRANVEMEI